MGFSNLDLIWQHGAETKAVHFKTNNVGPPHTQSLSNRQKAEFLLTGRQSDGA